jgi:3-oxoacyl-[acyl-carrier protein] reductase
LIKAFAAQLVSDPGSTARIVAFTSDHVAHNLPYGASKGALDRIVLAAATELAHLGVTANVINPGATDTGWMSPGIVDAVRARNLQPRVGRPEDAANLVGFLLSPEGSWINGQLLCSDGGLRR